MQADNGLQQIRICQAVALTFTTGKAADLAMFTIYWEVVVVGCTRQASNRKKSAPFPAARGI